MRFQNALGRQASLHSQAKMEAALHQAHVRNLARGTSSQQQLYDFMGEGRILVVDDEDLVRGVLILMLEDAGYTTLGASDARKALLILEAEPVAVVVSDIDMPGGIDGLELAWEVSARWPETGILLMSGRLLPRPNDLPPRASFIAKPCNEVHLLEHVAAAVNGPSS